MSRRRRALFLDRDGVVNVDHGYVHTIERFEFVDGIFEFCAQAAASGFELVIVTNQSGIARGLFSEAQFHELMAWLGQQFASRGLKLARYYYCPDHPDGMGRYRRRSFMRKPAPGMLLRAADDLDLDLSRCVLIGDRESDIAAGRAAGLAATIHHATGASPAPGDANVSVADLTQAREWLAGWNDAYSAD